MPPLSWCGYSSIRRSAFGISTGLQHLRSRVPSLGLEIVLVERMPSMIWLPIVWTGLNAVIGSWKIIAISAPRIRRISFPVASSLSKSTTSVCPMNRSSVGDGRGSRR